MSSYRKLSTHSFALWAIVLLGLMSVSAAPAAQTTPARTVIHRQTGAATLIAFDPNAPGNLAEASARDLSPEVRAEVWLRQFAPQFGVDAGDLSLAAAPLVATNAATPIVTTRWQQTYRGIPVFGGQLVVNARDDGALLSINGEVATGLTLDVTPTLSADAAAAAALDYTSVRGGFDRSALVASATAFNIYDERLVTASTRFDPRLAYRIDILPATPLPVHHVNLIDAKTGEILLSYNKVHWDVTAGSEPGPMAAPSGPLVIGPRVPGTADLATYTAGNTQNLRDTFLCNESDLTCTDGADSDADAAHSLANGTYNFYWGLHGRDSLDDAGMQLISTVHFAFGYCNAFWTGEEMGYGDGCGISIVQDDVVGHELTHGVTSNTSNLIYAYESGALNESFSDVWGELFDHVTSTGVAGDDTPQNRWAIGEEIFANDPGTPGYDPGIRSMSHPPLFRDPDRVNSPIFYGGYDDQYGVHINSGINNKAVYLMVDGDTFNSVTVNPVDTDKVLAVYYAAQTAYLTPVSDFNDVYLGLTTKCTELIGGAAGITAGDCTQITAALEAVEMNAPSRFAPITDVELCEAGQAANNLFFDDFEAVSNTDWTTQALAGSQLWNTSYTVSPISGSRSLFGDDFGLNNAATPPTHSIVTMTVDVAIPADAKLHFKHDLDVEGG